MDPVNPLIIQHYPLFNQIWEELVTVQGDEFLFGLINRQVSKKDYSKTIANLQNLPQIIRYECIERSRIKSHECGICLGKMHLEQKLSCGHAFHKTCINQWVNTSFADAREASCPLCRQEFKPRRYFLLNGQWKRFTSYESMASLL